MVKKEREKEKGAFRYNEIGINSITKTGLPSKRE